MTGLLERRQQLLTGPALAGLQSHRSTDLRCLDTEHPEPAARLEIRERRTAFGTWIPDDDVGEAFHRHARSA